MRMRCSVCKCNLYVRHFYSSLLSALHFTSHHFIPHFICCSSEFRGLFAFKSRQLYDSWLTDIMSDWPDANDDHQHCNHPRHYHHHHHHRVERFQVSEMSSRATATVELKLIENYCNSPERLAPDSMYTILYCDHPPPLDRPENKEKNILIESISALAMT